MPKTTLITTMHPNVKDRCSPAPEIGRIRKIQKNKAISILAPQRPPPVSIRLIFGAGSCRKHAQIKSPATLANSGTTSDIGHQPPIPTASFVLTSAIPATVNAPKRSIRSKIASRMIARGSATTIEPDIGTGQARWTVRPKSCPSPAKAMPPAVANAKSRQLRKPAFSLILVNVSCRGFRKIVRNIVCLQFVWYYLNAPGVLCRTNCMLVSAKRTFLPPPQPPFSRCGKTGTFLRTQSLISHRFEGESSFKR